MAVNSYRENSYRTPETPTQTPISTPQASSGRKLKIRFLKDRRFQLVMGFFYVFFSVYLLTSLISYLFTGRADQSLVENASDVSVQEAGSEVENWLGLYGAKISYYLVYRWFGLGSFLFVPLFFYYGYKNILRQRIFSIQRYVLLMAFVILWLSFALGYVVSNLPENSWFSLVAGGAGYQFATFVKSLLGWGTIFVVVLGLLAFVIYFFNVTTLKKDKITSENQSPEKKATIATEQVAENIKNTETRFDEMPITSLNPEELEIKLVRKGDKTPTSNYKPSTDDLEGEQTTLYQQPNYQENDTENDLDDDLLDLDEELDESISEEKFHEKYVQPEPKNVINFTETTVPLELEPTFVNPKITPEKEVSFAIETPISDIKANYLAFETEKNTETIPQITGNYDPNLDLFDYQFPVLGLLNEPKPEHKLEVNMEELQANKNKIVDTLNHYNIGITEIKATIGPTVTLYEIVPKPGVRISKIKNLEDDIALSLAALGIRIIAPIPGKGTIGIEVPSTKREMVMMKTLLASDAFQKTTMDLPIVFGKTISNEVFMIDLAKMPHILMAGATGQGKSVGLNVILTSLLYKKHPSELKFVLVDPKKVELTLFNKIERHFLAKLPDEENAIITDTSKVINTLNSLCIEMDNRYDLLKSVDCRTIKEYNQKFKERRLNPEKGHRFLPFIVLVIDELADLMMTAGKEVEMPISRLAQLARAIGIHLVVATQRPSVNVITGLIKANFPARLSFRVTSKIDSRTILDTGGAEQLIGMGDMLFSMGSDVTRLQCAFLDTPEIENICAFIGSQRGYGSAYLLPEFVGESGSGNASEKLDMSEKDELFEEAARIIVMHQQGSTSLLQRRLKLGYNRAGRIIDQLEQAGVVGAFEGSKAREVLVSDEYALEQLLKNLK